MKLNAGDIVSFQTASIKRGLGRLQTFTKWAYPGTIFLIVGYENFGREVICQVK